MLARMYKKWAEKNKFSWFLISRQFGQGIGPKGREGIKEITAEIKGKFAYGLLKNESGIHRLVRISPFSAKKLRHTSFAGVEILPQVKDLPEVIIRPDDIKVETFRASGPGGQYVNKRESAVRITHLPTGIVVSSQTERLQGLNRDRAMKVLKAKLAKNYFEKSEREKSNLRGERKEIDFANQIRSYVLHPYRLVKDRRTGVEETNLEKVLNGDLNKFIEAAIMLKRGN